MCSVFSALGSSSLFTVKLTRAEEVVLLVTPSHCWLINELRAPHGQRVRSVIDHCNLLILWWKWEVAPRLLRCTCTCTCKPTGGASAYQFPTIRLLLAHSSFFVFALLSPCLNTFQLNTLLSPPPALLYVSLTHIHTLSCNLWNSICLQDSSLWDCQRWKSWDKHILSLGSSSLLLVFSKSMLSFHWKRSDIFKLLCNSLNTEQLLAGYCLLNLNKLLFVCLSIIVHNKNGISILSERYT